MATENQKSILLQDIQNIEILRKGTKLTEPEHNLMKAGVARLLKLVNDAYPDQPVLKKAEDAPGETGDQDPNQQ